MDKTIVIFRAERGGDFKGAVTAVFPEQAEDGGCVSCYAHIGQHGICSREWYRNTRPATPAEYADLKVELESYGPPDAHYILDVRKRWTRK